MVIWALNFKLAIRTHVQHGMRQHRDGNWRQAWTEGRQGAFEEMEGGRAQKSERRRWLDGALGGQRCAWNVALHALPHAWRGLGSS